MHYMHFYFNAQGGSMQVKIVSVGAYVPPKRISNDELAKSVDTSDEWIRSHTGIGNRHICSEEQAASDLAIEAAENALHSAGLEANDIDMIILATASPDYPGFPSTSCIVQERLGIRNCGAFDITAGCTGFVYGLEIGRSMVAAGSSKRVLVIGVEVLSKIVNWNDRNTCVLFGDGAGAVILEAAEKDESSGFIDSILRSDGSGAMSLVRKAGGSRNPFQRDKTPEEDLYIAMEGQQVYKFAVRVNTELIKTILERNNVTVDDLSLIVPHQANVRIIQAAAGRLGIPLDRFFLNIEEYANTSAASIPIALDQLVKEKKLKKGDLLLFVGFGAGLTYGANLLRW
jgi:3-oxoacyl-[acyl-carrier-protein] synthase III